jgi:uracil-DNA glycosylase family 4
VIDTLVRLGALERAVVTCNRCTAARAPQSGARVVGSGPVVARLVLVGEAPGADEEQRGEPFVGSAGRVLDGWLLGAGIDRAEIRLMNALACRPVEPGKRPGTERNRTPKSAECAGCKPHALEQFDIIRPAAIVAVGDIALRLFGTVLPEHKAMRETGQMPAFEAWAEPPGFERHLRNPGQGRGARLYAIYHPAFRMRLEGVDRPRAEAVDAAAIAVLRAAIGHVREVMSGEAGDHG